MADLVERCRGHARAIARGIGELEGAELLWEPTLNQGLARFLDPSPAADHDGHTDRVIGAIVKSGEAYFGGTFWRGRRAMRISVINWRTTESDVARAIEAARRAVASERGAA